MKISLEDAKSLLVGIGLKSAGGWDSEKVAKRLEGLGDLIDEGTEVEDSDLQALVEGCLAALEDDTDGVVELTATKPKGKKPKGKKSKTAQPEPEPEEGEDEDNDDDDDVGEEAEEKPKTKRKPKAKKGKGKKDEGEKPQKPTTKKRTKSRRQCACEILLGLKRTSSTEKLNERCDAAYAKSGGDSNPNESAHSMRSAIIHAELFGVVTVDGKKVSPAEDDEE